MAFREALTNFSKGEIAPELYGRFDVETYHAGLARARNVVVLKTGAITKRPGTYFVGEVYDSTQPARLLPFQFSIEQSYALEFGQGTMRPAALGGFVLEAEVALTGVVTGNPTTLTVPYHAYVVGDDVYVNGVTGMTQINGRVFRVLQVLDDQRIVVDLDSRLFSVFTGAIGGTLRTAPAVPPPVPPVVPPVVVPPPPPEVLPPGGYLGGASGGGGGGNGNGYPVNFV